MSFETKIENIGKDILKGIEYPVLFTVKAEKVLATAIQDQPELKSILTQLVTKSEAIAGDVAKDTAEKGLNLADDAATLAEVEAFFTFVKTTVAPEIVKLYGEIKTDVA